MSLVNKFISQDDVDEMRAKKQAEWEKVRKPHEPIQLPEAPIDSRCLYDKLKEQELRKQEEWDESRRFKNQFRGLEKEEVQFLNQMDVNIQLEQEARERESRRIMAEVQNAVRTVPEPTLSTTIDVPKPSTLPVGASTSKSQQKLLMGVVKRKSCDAPQVSKEKAVTSMKRSREDDSDDDDETTPKKVAASETRKVAGLLPGLGAYGNVSSESGTSSDSSDSDLETSKGKR